ncbi:hypothetical protein OG533_17515 [Streptomyces sp. NBC_01186]|uniref:hypothetical protein n=1 Tax=Streptomyces sp. NBC_01186 TaxID=2903765 RepID=UPI002E10FBE4|nr:hypothetical protein OG533_17515 [Streptomyces sp. NBC_01186]
MTGDQGRYEYEHGDGRGNGHGAHGGHGDHSPPLPPQQPWPYDGTATDDQYGPEAYGQQTYGAPGAYGAPGTPGSHGVQGQGVQGGHQDGYGAYETYGAYGAPHEAPYPQQSFEPTYEVTRDTGPPPYESQAQPYAYEPPAHPGAGPLPPEHTAQPQPYAQPQPQPQPYGQQPQPQPYAQPPQAYEQPQPHPYAQPQPQPQPQAQRQPQPAPVATPPAPAPTPTPTPEAAPEPRRRTGSPIIAPGFQPAAVTAVLAALLAATAQLGHGALTGAVVLLQAVTAAGWYRLNGMWPARQGIALAFLAGVAADVGLLLTEGGRAPTVLIGAIGIWCVLSLVLQLRNHSSPDERLYALTAGLAATGLTVLAAGMIPAEADAVTVGAGTVAVAALARALPLPAYVSPLVALAAAAGAGVAVGQLTGTGPSAALLGLAAGVCALIGLRVASYDFPSRFVHMTAGVALPLTLATPALWLLGRALM